MDVFVTELEFPPGGMLTHALTLSIHNHSAPNIEGVFRLRIGRADEAVLRGPDGACPLDKRNNARRSQPSLLRDLVRKGLVFRLAPWEVDLVVWHGLAMHRIVGNGCDRGCGWLVSLGLGSQCRICSVRVIRMRTSILGKWDRGT